MAEDRDLVDEDVEPGDVTPAPDPDLPEGVKTGELSPDDGPEDDPAVDHEVPA